MPQNWRPSAIRLAECTCSTTPRTMASLAGRTYWYVARIDYRRNDGSRGQQDLYRIYLPPEQIPAGSFCQDVATGRVYVRLPADAQNPCPIGTHMKLSPQQAIGYYVGRDVHGPAEKYRGKLVTAALAKAMTQDGIQETDAVATSSCVFGTPTLEKGCPILGIYHDADSQARPEGPLTLSTLAVTVGQAASTSVPGTLLLCAMRTTELRE